jgi:hypothetical protein
MISKGLARHWNMATAAILVAVTFFSALVQSGILAPDLHLLSTGRTFGSQYVGSYQGNIQNLSWRSWTITGVQMAAGKPSVILPDRSVITVGRVYRGVPQPFTNTSAHPAVLPLSVGPGQQITVTLVQKDLRICRPVNQQFQQDLYDIPVDLVFSTPFGSRDELETFPVSYGCPHP